MHRTQSNAPTALLILSTLWGYAAGPAMGQSTTWLSAGMNGAEPDGNSRVWSMSSDGRYVAFHSLASNLVVGDTNNGQDCFVRDTVVGQTILVSVPPAGGQFESAGYPSISGDGRYVAFGNESGNIFIRDLEQNITVGIGASGGGHLSYNGRFYAFESGVDIDPIDTGDTNGLRDIYIYDRDPDENGIFDEGNSIFSLISISTAGVLANNSSNNPAISGDGRHIAFWGDASNLVDTPDCCPDPEHCTCDNNGAPDVFVRDRTLGTTVRVSLSSAKTHWGEEGNSGSYVPAISKDGRYIAFASDASNFIDGIDYAGTDVYVHDRDLDGNGTFDEQDSVDGFKTVLVSVNSAGAQAETSTYIGTGVGMSATGRFVTLGSSASNLDYNDTNVYFDVFVHDRDADDDREFDEPGSISTNIICISSDCSPADERTDAGAPVSEDGRFIAFSSWAENLVPGDDPDTPQPDVFLRDRGPCVVPSVNQHPIAPAGPWQTKGEYMLSVVAIGDEPLSYQWYKDDVALTDDAGRISGSQTPMLTVSNVKFADAGQYRATVRNNCTCDPGLCECEGEGCLCGRADSATVEITVICPGDANQDSTVDPLDAGFVQARFGCVYPDDGENCLLADPNGDGAVDPLDVGFVLARFGACE